MTASEIYSKVRRLTYTTTNDWSDADMVTDLNAELTSLQINILRDRGALEFDDLNYADVPIATFNTTAGTPGYKLVEDEDGNEILTIHKVAIKIGDNLTDVPRQTVAEGNQDVMKQTSQSVPQKYYEVGNSIYFSPIPDGSYEVTVWLDRAMDFLTTSDTTKEPGLPTAYHNLLCYKTALNYHKLDDRAYQKYMQRVQIEEERLQQYEENRRVDEQTVMSVDTIRGL